jgi:hypothetical protein
VISKTLLVLAEGFGEGLDAERVATAISRGLGADGRLECDLCPLEEEPDAGPKRPGTVASAVLDGHDFDTRMRAARALVIAWARLDDRALAGSIAFEAATRARQAGVPAYAVTAHDRIDPFEARIVDLQVVLEAGSTRALSAAGRKLAALV